MIREIVAILITWSVIASIMIWIKSHKGVKLKFGGLGLMLILLPGALMLARTSEDLWSPLLIVVCALIGVFLVFVDFPKPE